MAPGWVTAQVSWAGLGWGLDWEGGFPGNHVGSEEFEKLGSRLLKGNVSNSREKQGEGRRAPWLRGSVLAPSQTGSLPDFYFWCLVVKLKKLINLTPVRKKITTISNIDPG